MDTSLPLLLQPREPWPWSRMPWPLPGLVFIQPSKDGQRAGARSQDAIGLYNQEQVYIVVVSDGVSQSFFGDFAAWVLTEHLLQALQGLEPSSSVPTVEEWIQWGAHLRDYVSEQYRLLKIPLDLPPMMQRVLREKQRLGSETMFAAMRLDLPTAVLPQGRLIILQAGNVRVRLWGEQAGTYDFPLDESSRWSTRHGFTRSPQIHEFPLRDARGSWLWDGIVMYTDGIASLDKQSMPLELEQLERLAHADWLAPSSDDQAYVDLRWNMEPPVAGARPWPQVSQPLEPPRPIQRDSRLEWRIPRDGLYSRLQWQDTNHRNRVWSTPENSLDLPSQAQRARVQVVDVLGRPTSWSPWIHIEASDHTRRMTKRNEKAILTFVEILLILYFGLLFVKGYAIW